MGVGTILVIAVASAGAIAFVAFAVVAWQWERRRSPRRVTAEAVCPACSHPLATAYARECPRCGHVTRYGRMVQTKTLQWEFAALAVAGVALLSVALLGHSSNVAGAADPASKDAFIAWADWMIDRGPFWLAGAAVLAVVLVALFRKRE